MQQLMQKRKLTDPDKPLTPIEKLLSEKNEIQAKCRMREKKLNANFDYFRDNASGLIISGLSYLLFSSGREKNKQQEQTVAVISKNKQSQESAPFSFDNLSIIAKSLVPLAWTIIQPILVRWAIKKAKLMLLGLFSKKSRKSNVK